MYMFTYWCIINLVTCSSLNIPAIFVFTCTVLYLKKCLLCLWWPLNCFMYMTIRRPMFSLEFLQAYSKYCSGKKDIWRSIKLFMKWHTALYSSVILLSVVCVHFTHWSVPAQETRGQAYCKEVSLYSAGILYDCSHLLKENKVTAQVKAASNVSCINYITL